MAMEAGFDGDLDEDDDPELRALAAAIDVPTNWEDVLDKAQGILDCTDAEVTQRDRLWLQWFFEAFGQHDTYAELGLPCGCITETVKASRIPDERPQVTVETKGYL